MIFENIWLIQLFF